MKMINKIIEDIEKYIINFKDSNFGNLESLNKYKLENLEFLNYFLKILVKRKKEIY